MTSRGGASRKKERGHRVVSLFCFAERGRHAGRDERRAASADAPDDAARVRGAPRTHHRRNGLERRGPVGYRRGVGPLQRRPEGHPEGGDIEIKGRWQGNDFVVERKVSGGRKVTEDYLRSQDGKQLYVIVKFEGRTRPLDRVPACVRRRRSDVALWHPRKQSAPDLLESGAHHVSLRTAPAVSAP